jgi:hypothetical protein
VSALQFADGRQHAGPLISSELEVYLATSDDLSGSRRYWPLKEIRPASPRALGSNWPTQSQHSLI